MAEAWAAEEVYDWYGVGDTGLIATEGPDLDGMHIMEDAHFVEILDPADQGPAATGETGELVCTCLYKDDAYPIIRFNTRDLSARLPGENALGLPFARIAGFLGRSDNMVKHKGINFYPEAAGAVFRELDEYAGDYLCVRQGEEFLHRGRSTRSPTAGPCRPHCRPHSRTPGRARAGSTVRAGQLDGAYRLGFSPKATPPPNPVSSRWQRQVTMESIWWRKPWFFGLVLGLGLFLGGCLEPSQEFTGKAMSLPWIGQY